MCQGNVMVENEVNVALTKKVVTVVFPLFATIDQLIFVYFCLECCKHSLFQFF